MKSDRINSLHADLRLAEWHLSEALKASNAGDFPKATRHLYTVECYCADAKRATVSLIPDEQEAAALKAAKIAP